MFSQSFSLILLCTAWPNLLLVLSPSTPEYLPELVEEEIGLNNLFISGVKVDSVQYHTLLPTFSGETLYEIILDATFLPTLTQEISHLCTVLSLLHIVLFPVDDSQLTQGTYTFGGAFQGTVAALKAVKRHFNFGTVNVISDIGDFSRYFLTALTEDEKNDYEQTCFPPNSDETKITGKIVRPKGNRISLFAASPAVTKAVLKAQYRMHIGQAGYGNILPIYSALYDVYDVDTEETLINGNLIVAEGSFADARSQLQYTQTAIARFLTYLEQSPTVESLRYHLSTSFPPPGDSPVYHIFNQQAGNWVFVGTVTNGTYTPTGTEVQFLGNTTTVPQNSSAPLPISGNFGNTDPIDYYYPLQPMYAGAVLAIAEVNRRGDILPTFFIELWNFTGGYSRYNETYLRAVVMPERDKFGSAMITSIASPFNIPFLELMKEYEDLTPVIGSATTFVDLSSRKNYPNFLRTCTTDDFLNIIIIQIFKRFGWTQCGIVIEDIFSSGAMFQSRFHTLMAASGISIVNDPQYQILSANVSSVTEAIDSYSVSLQHFIDTRARILLVISSYVGKYVPVVLHTLGLRQGDVIIVTREWLDSYAFQGLTDEDVLKAGEVMKGALQFSPDRFVGTVGGKLLSTFEAVYGMVPSSFACLYYDSAMTIAVALDWLVNAGLDYMNHTVMMTALRQARFTGCSGIVSFEATSNDRNEVRFILETIVFNGTSPSMQRAGLYDPHGMVLLSIVPNYTWPDGTITVPADARKSTIGCPFEDRLNTAFPAGQTVLIGLCAATVICTVLTCVVLLVLMRRRKLEHLTKASEIEIEDTLVIISVFVEVVQLLALGPSLEYVSYALQLTLDAFVWNGERFLPLQNGGYEKLWIFAQGTVAFWLFCTVYTYVWRKRRSEYSFKLLEIASYLIETWLFPPIVSILMDSFVCRSGLASLNQSVTFQTSFLQSDCYVLCWQSGHLLLFSLSIVSILVFIPLSALQATTWQENQSDLHIKWSVGYVMARTIVNTTLISLWKIEKDRNSTVHGACFSVVLMVYLGISVCRGNFGYARTRFWHLIGIAAVLYASLVSTAESIVGDRSKSVVFTCFVVVGWGFFGLFGVIYQKFRLKPLLYRPEGINTLYLFKFAFKPANETILSDLQSEFHRVAHSRTLVHLRTAQMQRVTTNTGVQCSSEHNT